ncbi:hypothetical protein SCLCIDRAFT_24554 [Scleroderma citrinum Foug A]|uniref:Uncharacterized protein n=1 Tax=Scleroderma citrinum Foug A TaxID=1036808 RepID=A0A0C3ADE7_9AGAM|nr:hypothetical protein SCLCIDRAFT_24554 [Scleroderma citrinum Foug A]
MAFINDATREAISLLKRRINALEEENTELQGISKSSTKCPDKYLRSGRAIQRLVTLHDRVEDLVNEGDHRACLELEGDTTANSEEQDRLYRGYKQLLRWIPSLKSDLAADSEDYKVKLIMKDLNKAADSAHSDDTAGLKTAVVDWLMSIKPTPELALESHRKDGRGFYHNTTSRLICPMEYDWSNVQHRANIRGFDADYTVTTDSWPRFLYKSEQYDPNNPVKGLFRNDLLVQAFKHIFTSPSLTDSINDIDQEEGTSMEPLPKRQKGLSEKRTRAHVAALLGMKSVDPRAIAYTAVQLRFALSSCNAWCLIDEDFDYIKFYKNILLFFEDTRTIWEKDEISNLLYWWNRSVFGCSNTSVYHPQPVEKMSVASTLRKRCERLAARGELPTV